MDYRNLKKEWWQIGVIFGAVFMTVYHYLLMTFMAFEAITLTTLLRTPEIVGFYVPFLVSILSGMLLGGMFGFVGQVIRERLSMSYIKQHMVGTIMVFVIGILTLNAFMSFLPFQPLNLPFTASTTRIPGNLEVKVTDLQVNPVPNTICQMEGDNPWGLLSAFDTMRSDSCRNPFNDESNYYSPGTALCLGGVNMECVCNNNDMNSHIPLGGCMWEQSGVCDPGLFAVLPGSNQGPWNCEIYDCTGMSMRTSRSGVCRYDNLPSGEFVSIRASCADNQVVYKRGQASIYPSQTSILRLSGLNCGAGCIVTNNYDRQSCIKDADGHTRVYWINNCGDKSGGALDDCTAKGVGCFVEPKQAYCKDGGVIEPPKFCQGNGCELVKGENCHNCPGDCGPCPTLPEYSTCTEDCWDTGSTGGTCRASETACAAYGQRYEAFGFCTEPISYCCCNSVAPTQPTTRPTTTTIPGGPVPPGGRCTWWGECAGSKTCNARLLTEPMCSGVETGAPYGYCATHTISVQCCADNDCAASHGVGYICSGYNCIRGGVTTTIRSMCNFNGYCEPAYGETFATCKSDCKCNYNNECDLELGENYVTCPNDCGPGVTTTPPTAPPVFCNYNRYCDLNLGENYLTCPSDCEAPPSGWDLSTNTMLVIVGIVLMIIILVAIKIYGRK